MSIPIPNWLWDYAPWIAVGVTAFIVFTLVLWLSVDMGSSREYCASLGMLYNPDYHGCVEGVVIP